MGKWFYCIVYTFVDKFTNHLSELSSTSKAEINVEEMQALMFSKIYHRPVNS